ncbi:MAG TPA: hypothetical protein VNK73_07225 [Actinomycetota bacterium]|nr:hypothetical protein [Actinomycetota bacterium]
MTVAVLAALLPHPPLLVPQLAGGAAGELDPLRSACHKALDAVLSASGALVVIGDGPVWGIAARAAVGSFAPYGADIEVQLPPDHLWVDIPALPEPHRLEALPLSLAIAAWLLDTAAPGRRGGRLTLVRDDAPRVDEPVSATGAPGTAPLSAVPPAGDSDEVPGRGGPPRAVGNAPDAGGDGAPVAGRRAPPLVACTVPATLGPGAATAVGRALVEALADRGPVGMIAMADLSARRTEAAPGAFHPAAAAFDAGIARAFASGDLTALAEVDPAEAAELRVGGRAVLQAMAGGMQGGGPLAGQVLYDQAPYGVGYLVGIVEHQAVDVPERAGEPA